MIKRLILQMGCAETVTFLHTAYCPLYTCQEQVLKRSLLRVLSLSNEFTCAMEQGRWVFGAKCSSRFSPFHLLTPPIPALRSS